MSPDDPRHGTSRGYVLGCREECCRRAQMIYMKRYRMGQTPRFTDPTGSYRRIQALSALGHSSRAISESVGHQVEWARSVLLSPRITTTTAQKVRDAYDKLSMTRPEGHAADRTRREAAAKGWLPPLAWDDDRLDDPNITAVENNPEMLTSKDIDPVVVERVLAGDMYLHTNRAEREELVRRYLALGRPLADFERAGWKPERYGQREQVAS